MKTNSSSFSSRSNESSLGNENEILSDTSQEKEHKATKINLRKFYKRKTQTKVNTANSNKKIKVILQRSVKM